MTLHKDLTGADLHEPKGISGATSGQIYTANGAGSGAWSSLVIPSGLFNITTAVFTSSGTWTKPTGMFMAKVTVIGGGGDGTAGTNGGTSSFGAYVSATGTTILGSSPGTGIGGDFNFPGVSVFQTSSTDSIYSKAVPGIKLGTYGESAATSASASAGAAVKYLYSTTGTVTVTVGAGAAAAKNGVVLVEQYIPV